MLAVWAAPGARETLPKGGEPSSLMVSPGVRGRPDRVAQIPKIKDLRSFKT
jgi:hypothetical protein